MKPIVAIVGRPNVGKSTLFNRLTKTRDAIVHDMPGVTRDRNYGDVNWYDKPFTVIDTGGFEPVSKDKILSQMREQTQLAIEEAQAIIFLMDGREGLTPADLAVSDILRQTKKAVYYAVNKIDGEKHEELGFDFYRLGIDHFHTISAEHNRGVNDLIDEVVQAFPEELEDEDRETVNIAIIGRPNVGKSSLVNKLLGENRLLVSDVPGTTRDAVDTILEKNDKKYLLIDTAGIRRKSKVSERLEKYTIVKALGSIDRCNVVLLLIDASEGVTEQDVKVAGYAHEKGKGCIVIVNKWDLIEKDNSTIGKYVEQVKEDLKYMNYPPSYQGKFVKIYFATQIASSPPTFIIFTNYPKGIHFSYERYLENKVREAFGFEGTPFRLLFKERAGRKQFKRNKPER
jgi:GTP-binding protein